MESQTLEQPAGSGNFAAVEARWEALVLDPQSTFDDVVAILPAIEQLAGRDSENRLEALVATGLELIRERWKPAEALRVAGPLWLRLPKSESLRGHVAALYADVHAGRPGLDRLLDEAGLNGGRPARRALQTLDVALAIEPGSYLVSRRVEGVVQVVNIDAAWNVGIRGADGESTLTATELADDYAPVEPEDYRVLRIFQPERFRKVLWDDPAAVLVNVLQAAGKSVDSDTLEKLLCPQPLTHEEWRKWWTKARTSLKNCAAVRVEGRSPYYLTYDPQGSTPDHQARRDFNDKKSVPERWAVVEDYLRECKARKSTPDSALLRTFHEEFRRTAERETQRQDAEALACWLRSRELSILLGIDPADDGADRLLRQVPDPVRYLESLDQGALWVGACEALRRARPGESVAILAGILPTAPYAACETIAQRLHEWGYPAEAMQGLVQAIVAEPFKCGEALFWLWDGPRVESARPPDVQGLFARLLRLLGDIQRQDQQQDPETVKRIRSRARSALSARNYQRFTIILEGIDAGMASTIKTQLKRITGLGTAVPEEMLKLIQQRFPESEAAPNVPSWKREDLLLVTANGLAKREAELAELVNVKMRQNAIAIGEAASHGDLSENSEFKFALEERDLLQARGAQMRKELAMARILSRDDVSPTQITPGCKTVLRHVDDGRTFDLVLLGPWEANIDEYVYNYKSPVGQSLMGLALGESVDMNVGQLVGKFEVTSIAPAIT